MTMNRLLLSNLVLLLSVLTTPTKAARMNDSPSVASR